MKTLTIESQEAEKFVCNLNEHDLYLRSSWVPKKSFVSQIADRVARNTNIDKPGFVVIPNTLGLFYDKAHDEWDARNMVQIFQQYLMSSLSNYLKHKMPRSLEFQDFLNLPVIKAQGVYDRAVCDFKSLYVNGVNSEKSFHLDGMAQLFVSLCYGQRRNVRGGDPQFLDLLRAKYALGFKSVKNLINYFTLDEYDEELYHPLELAAVLKPELAERVQDFAVRITGLDFSKMPMVIFTNRIEDGIAHGASRVMRKNTNTWAVRDIEYFAIGYKFDHSTVPHHH